MRPDAAGEPRRVRVVGATGAGKTTLARLVADRLGVPLVEVDTLLRLPGGVTASQERFAAAVDAARDRAPDGWVVDGNWATVATALADPAEAVVWLDPPRAVVLARLLRRTLGELLLRRQRWPGHTLRWRDLLSPDASRNVVLWAWREVPALRVRYREVMAGDGRRWVVLRRPGDARRWSAALRARAARSA